MEKLRNTNSCPGCDLHGAGLRVSNLEGANLSGARVKGAHFLQVNGLIPEQNLKKMVPS
ncbi:MAG: pentapeptide repeat-containing protein [Planctomycetota bacterium]